MFLWFGKENIGLGEPSWRRGYNFLSRPTKMVDKNGRPVKLGLEREVLIFGSVVPFSIELQSVFFPQWVSLPGVGQWVSLPRLLIGKVPPPRGLSWKIIRIQLLPNIVILRIFIQKCDLM